MSQCVVVSTAQGRFVWYQLRDTRIAELLELAALITKEAAQGMAECARYE